MSVFDTNFSVVFEIKLSSNEYKSTKYLSWDEITSIQDSLCYSTQNRRQTFQSFGTTRHLWYHTWTGLPHSLYFKLIISSDLKMLRLVKQRYLYIFLNLRFHTLLMSQIWSSLNWWTNATLTNRLIVYGFICRDKFNSDCRYIIPICIALSHIFYLSLTLKLVNLMRINSIEFPSFQTSYINLVLMSCKCLWVNAKIKVILPTYWPSICFDINTSSLSTLICCRQKLRF